MAYVTNYDKYKKWTVHVEKSSLKIEATNNINISDSGFFKNLNKLGIDNFVFNIKPFYYGQDSTLVDKCDIPAGIRIEANCIHVSEQLLSRKCTIVCDKMFFPKELNIGKIQANIECKKILQAGRIKKPVKFANIKCPIINISIDRPRGGRDLHLDDFLSFSSKSKVSQINVSFPQWFAMSYIYGLKKIHDPALARKDGRWYRWTEKGNRIIG